MPQRIFLLEDDPLVLELLKLNLQHAGYAVSFAQSLTEARRFLVQEKEYKQECCLVMVDVLLKDGNGLEFLPLLRAEMPAIPVLLITAITDTATKVRGLDAGADDYLTKPFDLEELLARVRALLRRPYAQGTTPPHKVDSF